MLGDEVAAQLIESFETSATIPLDWGEPKTNKPPTGTETKSTILGRAKSLYVPITPEANRRLLSYARSSGLTKEEVAACMVARARPRPQDFAPACRALRTLHRQRCEDLLRRQDPLTDLAAAIGAGQLAREQSPPVSPDVNTVSECNIIPTGKSLEANRI
jgi:hypothetical protein